MDELVKELDASQMYDTYTAKLKNLEE